MATGNEFGVNSLLVAAGIQAAPAYLPFRRRGCPSRVRGETSVVSTASWHPPKSGKPLAMTSIRRSSKRWTLGMFKSATLVLVVTRAPASRQIRAAARSSGPPQLRRSPDCAQAERWSPKGSRVRRHRQERADNGKGRRGRRRSKRRKCSEEYVDRDGGENSAGIRPTLGFEESLAGWRQCLLEFCPEGLVE